MRERDCRAGRWQTGTPRSRRCFRRTGFGCTNSASTGKSSVSRKRPAWSARSRVRICPGRNTGWVVDATGSAGGLRSAVHMVRPRGTVILKSTLHGEVPVDSAPVIVNEITLIGSRCGPFEPALELLRMGAIDVSSMITERLPLSDAERALERAGQPGVLKVLLTN